MQNFYIKGTNFSKKEKLIPLWEEDIENLINEINKKFKIKLSSSKEFIDLIENKIPKDVSKTQAKLLVQEILILLREALVRGELVTFGPVIKQMQIATTVSFAINKKTTEPSLRIKSNKTKKIKCLLP